MHIIIEAHTHRLSLSTRDLRLKTFLLPSWWAESTALANEMLAICSKYTPFVLHQAWISSSLASIVISRKQKNHFKSLVNITQLLTPNGRSFAFSSSELWSEATSYDVINSIFSTSNSGNGYFFGFLVGFWPRWATFALVTVGLGCTSTLVSTKPAGFSHDISRVIVLK